MAYYFPFYMWKLCDLFMIKTKLSLTLYFTNIDWLCFQKLMTELEGGILSCVFNCVFWDIFIHRNVQL